MKPHRISLIRHGESEGNVDPRLYATKQDHKLNLSPVGVEQAKEAGRRYGALIGGERVMVYASPHYRTRQTAQNLLLGVPKEQRYGYYEDPRLREMEWGNFRSAEENQRIEAERDAYGAFYYRIQSGESGADCFDRCSSFLDTLWRDFAKETFPENALIVSHGLTIRLFIMRWFHLSVEEFETLRNPRNCQRFDLALGANGKYQLTEPYPRKN